MLLVSAVYSSCFIFYLSFFLNNFFFFFFLVCRIYPRARCPASRPASASPTFATCTAPPRRSGPTSSRSESCRRPTRCRWTARAATSWSRSRNNSRPPTAADRMTCVRRRARLTNQQAAAIGGPTVRWVLTAFVNRRPHRGGSRPSTRTSPALSATRVAVCSTPTRSAIPLAERTRTR